MDALDLEVATEFLLIAATLVELKTRRLLPGDDDVDLDDELALWEERDLLLARLLECKTFKDAAVVLAPPASDGARCYPRLAGLDERFARLAPDLLAGVGPDDLRRAFLRVAAPGRSPGSTSTTSPPSGPASPTPSTSWSTSCPGWAGSPSGRSPARWSSASRSSSASWPSSSCSSRAWSTSTRPATFGDIDIVWLGRRGRSATRAEVLEAVDVYEG